MVKVGPRLPRLSRREIEKKEKEQRRAAQIENGEDPQSTETEPYQLLEPAAQRKRARHRSLDDADLEDSKKKREKTLKRREARRLAKQAERELARREGSQGCVEDSLEYLLAEIDRRYNDYEHLASQTPTTRSESQQNGAGDTFVIPSNGKTMEGVTASLYSSTTTESNICLPLVSPSASMMSIDAIATPEDRFEVTPLPLQEPRATSLVTSATVSSEEPDSMLVTSNFERPVSLHHPQNAVVASEMPTTNLQSQRDSTYWLPVLQLPESLSQTLLPTPATISEAAVRNPVASGATEPLQHPFLPFSRSSLFSADSSTRPSAPSEPSQTSDFTSSNSGPSPASLNLPETPRISVLGTTGPAPNDRHALDSLASFTYLASSSSIIPSVSGSSLTRASHVDLGSTTSSTSTGSSASVAPTNTSAPRRSTTQASPDSKGLTKQGEETPRTQQSGTTASGPSTGPLGVGVVNQCQATPSSSAGTQPMAPELTTAARAAAASRPIAPLPTRAIANTSLGVRQDLSGNNSASSTHSAAPPALRAQSTTATVRDTPSSTPDYRRMVIPTIPPYVPKAGGQSSAIATPSVARPSPSQFSVARQIPIPATTACGATHTQFTAKHSAAPSVGAHASLALVPSRPGASSRPAASAAATARALSRTADVVAAAATFTVVNQMAPSMQSSVTVNVPTPGEGGSRILASRQTTATIGAPASTEGTSRLLPSRAAMAPRNVVSGAMSRLLPANVASSREFLREERQPTLSNAIAESAPMTASLGRTASSSTSSTGNCGVLTDNTVDSNVDPPAVRVASLEDKDTERVPTDKSGRPVTNGVADENQSPLPTVGLSANSEGGENESTVPEADSPVGPSGSDLFVANEVDESEPPDSEVDAPVDPSRPSIPDLNLPNDDDPAVVGRALTRRRVRSDTFSSNVSDSANAETTGLDGRVPAPDSDRDVDGGPHGIDLFPRVAGSSQAQSTSLLAPAPIVEDARRPPVSTQGPELASDVDSELPRTAGMEAETESRNNFQAATDTSVTPVPSTPISEPSYPYTPQPRSGIIPPYSTPTSRSPRIFTLDLPSPRKAGKTTPILPIHDPHVPKTDEKRGSSIVYALKWVLRKTFGYFFAAAGR